MKITRRLQKRLKNLCHKWEWAWDHPFPGDIGQDGRWEISLYSLNDLAEAGFCGCAALAPLEDDHWAVIIRLEEEGESLKLARATLAEAKHALDLSLGADTPEIPADSDSADPWIGDEEEHQEILRRMQYSAEFARALRAEVDATLKDLPEALSPFGDHDTHS